MPIFEFLSPGSASYNGSITLFIPIEFDLRPFLYGLLLDSEWEVDRPFCRRVLRPLQQPREEEVQLPRPWS